MTRWLPHIHHGSSSSECTSDPEGGREGVYFAVCWFGFMLDITVSTVWRGHRSR